MKFVSKCTNYRITLSPGQPEEKASGRNAVPAVYVRFENGMANVDDEEMVKRMLTSKSYNTDFFLFEPNDPLVQRILNNQKANEPEHTITNLEYGHVGKVINHGPKVQVTPEMKSAVSEVAMEMATKMAAEMVKAQLEPMQKQMDALLVALGAKPGNEVPPVTTDTPKKTGSKKKKEDAPEAGV